MENTNKLILSEILIDFRTWNQEWITYGKTRGKIKPKSLQVFLDDLDRKYEIKRK